jgi:hypothetical protein
MFWKLDLLPSSGEGQEICTLLGPLERANLHRSTPSELVRFCILCKVMQGFILGSDLWNNVRNEHTGFI